MRFLPQEKNKLACCYGILNLWNFPKKTWWILGACLLPSSSSSFGNSIKKKLVGSVFLADWLAGWLIRLKPLTEASWESIGKNKEEYIFCFVYFRAKLLTFFLFPSLSFSRCWHWKKTGKYFPENNKKNIFLEPDKKKIIQVC